VKGPLTVVLPQVSKSPTGGYKVAYEIADGVAARGHDVRVVHLRSGMSIGFGALSNWKYDRRGRPQWFGFQHDVAVGSVSPRERLDLPAGSCVLLTAWQTVEWYSAQSVVGRDVAQLVYDFEHWMVAEGATKLRLERALRTPGIRRIAMSSAVASMLDDIGSDYVASTTCGVGLDTFRCTVPPAGRAPVLGIPLRPQAWKASRDAIAAAAAVREIRSDLRVVAFGPGVDGDVPAWIDFRGVVSDEALVSLYNECAVFALPSHYEGWGLPAAEAMACGAAVVSTANGGVVDFATDGTTALIVDVARPEEMAMAILRLLDDPSERIRIAEEGCRVARAMTWSATVDVIERVLWATPSRPGAQ
jgi:glycosyltransferase involved in cell wall biosynthesis